MGEPIVVVGAGGFGREVLDVIDAINRERPDTWTIAGVVDDSPSDANLAHLAKRDVAHLGPSDALAELAASTAYVIGVGNPAVRRRIADTHDAARPAATLIHPAATLGYDVVVGAGTVVCAGARLTTHIRVGRHVHVNPNATVGHDTVLADFVSLNPQAAVSGDCHVGEATLIGVAGVVLNGLTIGPDCVVGGAACVVKDVPAGSVVKGVPAR